MDDQSTPERNAALTERARALMPGGVAHEMRYQEPHAKYITHAAGARKWDVEGKEYVDFAMGSASLLLGHAHPDIVQALVDQAPKGTFFADCHPLELEWAGLITDLIPSGDQVRFTGSGTESTLLAMRLGRAKSGRDGVLRIDGHYHGWHDHALKGMTPGANAVVSQGVPQAITDLIQVTPPDIEVMERTLKNDGSIGTLIVEASGANYGVVPLPDGFLAEARRLADEHELVLVFDEVITGFRWSPGGRQALDGVTPDVTTLAKILTGGLPGGAVAGKRDVMRYLDPGETIDGLTPAVTHKGTFNGNPLAAAAGVACLRHVATGEPQAVADAAAENLRAGMRDILANLGVEGTAYGDSSTFHLFFGPCSTGDIRDVPDQVLRAAARTAGADLNRGLLDRGVNLMSRMSGVLSAAHTDADIAHALDAFEATVKEMADSGVFSG